MSLFPETIQIGNRRVGAGFPVFIIAEAGVAHFGKFELALQLLELAQNARADAFKLQVFDVETLISSRLADWRERLRPRTLTFEQLREIKRRCDAAGILFLLTAHDESKIPWLEQLDVAAIKVGSGERANIPFFKKLAALRKPVILSTGMYRLTDAREAVAAFAEAGARELALLHCTTAYPTPDAEVNLSAMDRLRAEFSGPVGYSDHTEDELAVLGAVARGASIIEKHITILRDVPNAQDWKVSAGPENFPALVRQIRRMEVLLGRGDKEVTASEEAAMKWALKSLVAARSLPAGHCLADVDLVAKRAGEGISPKEFPRLVGRKLRRALEADEPLSWEHLE